MRRPDFCELDGSLDPEASLESCDEALDTAPPRRGDCPHELLSRFGARMAEHGHSIRPDLMRSDREYAMWQLARARTTDDALLRHLAAQLFTCLADGRA